MTNREDVVSDIAAMNAYQLASEADCATPDSLESEGASFLTRVRDAALEALEDVALDEFDDVNDDGTLSQVADDAPSIYTYTKWKQFVDLAAWQEDPTDLGFDGTDMEQGAGVCLYIIAERLTYALLERIREAAQEDADEALDADQDEADDTEETETP